MKNQNTNPKAKQFSEELQTLLAKYQYRLVPELEFGRRGVLPVISIEDVIPPKSVVLPSTENSAGMVSLSEEETAKKIEEIKKS